MADERKVIEIRVVQIFNACRSSGSFGETRKKHHITNIFHMVNLISTHVSSFQSNLVNCMLIFTKAMFDMNLVLLCYTNKHLQPNKVTHQLNRVQTHYRSRYFTRTKIKSQKSIKTDYKCIMSLLKNKKPNPVPSTIFLDFFISKSTLPFQLR